MYDFTGKKGTDQPPRHDIADRFWFEIVGSGIGGGVTQKAMGGMVHSGEERAEQENGKTGNPQSIGGDDGSNRATGDTQKKPGLSSVFLHD